MIEVDFEFFHDVIGDPMNRFLAQILLDSRLYNKSSEPLIVFLAVLMPQLWPTNAK